MLLGIEHAVVSLLFLQIKYHENFEKAKGLKISVADDPETVRARKNMQTISQVVYHGELEKKQLMEESRPVTDEGPSKCHSTCLPLHLEVAR